MHRGRTTLSKFLIEQLRGEGDRSDLAALLVDVAAAIKAIAAMTAKGALRGALALDMHNAHGEAQKPLDVLAGETLLAHCEWGGLVAGMASQDLDRPYEIPDRYQRGRYLLVFDPLDGAANLDVNVAAGTLFSVLRHERGTAPETADYLQPGRSQAAAGYAIYGPSTMLVLTVGKGTHGFTLDREIGNFVLTHPNLQIAAETGEFAIDIGNERFWEPPVQRYVRECKAGSTGVRAHDFNMRWVASLVAEVHRILMRGGVFLHPLDLKDRAGSTTLRLLYEANPLALLVEQAGGLASTGREPVLDFEPVALHQGVPVIVGSRSEVERIVRYHREYDTGVDQPYVSPLFNERSLFRAEARV
jgi:fructose-1,6-bisphosphatase